MLSFCAILLCLYKASLAVDLLIYKNFAEVRHSIRGTGTFSYSFSSDEYSTIIPDSLSWYGTQIERQELLSAASSLKDSKVLVKQISKCDCVIIKATIINPYSMLLRNDDTGAYFYADTRSVEYLTTESPETGGYQLKIQFNSNSKSYKGTLGYFVSGLTWQPNYDLFLNNGTSFTFNAYANIKNEQQRSYEVDNTNLLGGNVQLASRYYSPVYETPVMFSKVASAGLDASSNIQYDGESKGLYSYLITTNFTLQPLSTIRLPFPDVSVKYNFYYQATSWIGPGRYDGVFQRNYDITPNRFMPAGVISIRQDTKLVGQTNLPDVPENYTQTITLEQDNDVRYVINGNLTSSDVSAGLVKANTYQLDITIQNFKKYTVETRLRLYGSTTTIINNISCPSANLEGTIVAMTAKIAKSDSLQCKMIVTLQYI